MAGTWECNNIVKHFLTQKSNQNLSPSILYWAEYLMMWLLWGWKIDQKFRSLMETAVSTPMAQYFPGQNHSMELFPLKGLLKVWFKNNIYS